MRIKFFNLGFFFVLLYKVSSKIWTFLQVPMFKSCGKNVRAVGFSRFSYKNIVLGNDVYIGPDATFMSEHSLINIGNKVLFGPGVTIMGGDHRINIVGTYMYDVKEKLTENDQDVTIESDVWIGSKAVILKGVTIGRGSVIGAGSVVTKSVPPYSIAVGNPAKVIRSRFSQDNIEKHEGMLRLEDQDVRI